VAAVSLRDKTSYSFLL